jgi:RNA polymerase sigma-70 factor (ECF subfamily)
MKVTGTEIVASTQGKENTVVASSDDLIIEQILEGNTDLFEEIIARYKRRIFAIARHFFRSPETVEDIVQETFTKAYFSLGSYRRGATCEQWLARIAVNNCYDELRRRKKRGESLITDLTENETAFLETRMAGSAFEANLTEAGRERAAEIAEKLLDRLSPEDRLIMTLLHCEENSVREISRLTGWSEAKVKIRAFRARNLMRRVLARLKLTERRLSGG